MFKLKKELIKSYLKAAVVIGMLIGIVNIFYPISFALNLAFGGILGLLVSLNTES